MTCDKCQSENIRTFAGVYLKKRIRFLPIWRETDIQLLYVCGDCGTVKVLVHEYENEYQRYSPNTSHYASLHISPANGSEICKPYGNDGFANYIATRDWYYFSKKKTKIDFKKIKVGNIVIVTFSSWFSKSDSPPLYDPTGDYSVILDRKRYPIVIPHGSWSADQWA